MIIQDVSVMASGFPAALRRMRGHERKRREGVWEVRAFVGRDPITGKEKQISKTVPCGAKAADAALRDLIDNLPSRTDGGAARLGRCA